MLRVAIMLERFSVGGAQRVVSELVKNIDQSQCDLLVICTESRQATQMAREVEKIARVVYLNVDKMSFAMRVKTVFRCLNEFKPHVINTHLTPHLYAVPWGIMHNVPVIITAHTKPNMAFVKKIEPLIKWGVRRKRVSIVAVSQENLQLMNTYLPGCESQCHCINNGIDIDSFEKRVHEKFTFINVARQDDNKNQAAILRSFAELYRNNTNLRLILLGDGPCHEKLCELSKELNAQDGVEIPGSVANVADYYAMSDVYVQASHREAMPMSVLEAMAAGLPILSSDIGGLRDVVTNNGYLYPDDQEEELLRYMRLFMKMDADEMKQMSIVSRKNVKPYSSKAMADKYLELFKRIADK